MTKRPTESRGGVKGGTSSLFVCPLRGQGAELPCGVWGNAPIVFRAFNSKEAANKGAGCEASLPVTLRSRRSAHKLLFPPCCTLSRQMGATEHPAQHEKAAERAALLPSSVQFISPSASALAACPPNTRVPAPAATHHLTCAAPETPAALPPNCTQISHPYNTTCSSPR